MTQSADKVGGLRLAIMAIEYMLATQKEQVHEVVKQICNEFNADENGVMKELQSVLTDLKIEEETTRFSNSPESLERALEQMVEMGYMSKIGKGYKLTVLGIVYAKHQITNNPTSREFYKRLLTAHGDNPDADELLN